MPIYIKYGKYIGPMLVKKVETYAYVSIFPGHPCFDLETRGLLAKKTYFFIKGQHNDLRISQNKGGFSLGIPLISCEPTN